MINIFSPHIDDAILSLGGLVINSKEKGTKINIFNIFSISNWTNPSAFEHILEFQTVEEITALRKQEESIISKQLGYDFFNFDFVEQPLRAHNVDSQDLIQQIFLKVKSYVSTSDICWFPLGLGHDDHLIVRQVGLQLHKIGFDILFYEDLPYGALADYNYETNYQLLIESGLTPKYECIDIQAKIEFLKLYKSQVSLKWLDYIKNYSYCLMSNKFYERYWSFERH